MMLLCESIDKATITNDNPENAIDAYTTPSALSSNCKNHICNAIWGIF